MLDIYQTEMISWLYHYNRSMIYGDRIDSHEI